MASQNVTVNAPAPLPTPHVTPTNTQFVADVSPEVPNQRFKVAGAKITGGMQIACAVLSVVFGLMAVLTAVSSCNSYNSPDNSFPAVIGWPIWGGICFYLVAGILGVCTGQGKTCTIVAYMVMSILAATIAGGQICMESIGAAINSGCYSDDCGCSSILPAMHGMAAVVAFVEMVVAIVAAAFCCHGVCCHPTPTPKKIVIVQYSNQPNPQAQVFHQPQTAQFQSNPQAQVFHLPPTTQFQANPQAQVIHQPPTTQFQSNPQSQVFHQPPNINLQPNPQAEGRLYQELNAPPMASHTTQPQYEKIV